MDIYASLVLISRYGELPCNLNVPNTKCGNQPSNIDITETQKVPNNEITECKRLKWNLPDYFAGRLITVYIGCDAGSNILDIMISESAKRFPHLGLWNKPMISEDKGADASSDINTRDISSTFTERTVNVPEVILNTEKDKEEHSIKNTKQQGIKYIEKDLQFNNVIGSKSSKNYRAHQQKRFGDLPKEKYLRNKSKKINNNYIDFPPIQSPSAISKTVDSLALKAEPSKRDDNRENSSSINFDENTTHCSINSSKESQTGHWAGIASRERFLPVSVEPNDEEDNNELSDF